MSKNLYEFLHPNEPYNENDSPKLSDEEINLIKEACTPDYIRIINYLQKQENKSKCRNNITYICTIVAAVFAVLSVIISLIPYII